MIKARFIYRTLKNEQIILELPLDDTGGILLPRVNDVLQFSHNVRVIVRSIVWDFMSTSENVIYINVYGELP